MLFVSILTVASTMAVAKDDPVTIIQKSTNVQALGDVEAALTFFADDAVWDGGGLCRRSPCVGKAAIRKRLEQIAKNKGAVTPVATYQSGNVVTQRVEARHNSTRRAGVDRIICWSIWEVKGEKIVCQ